MRWRRLVSAGSLLALALCPAGADGQPATPLPWSGPYVGIELSGSLDSVDTTETSAATGAPFHRFTSLGAGPGAGVDLGYNWLVFADDMLVGVVAGVDGLHNPGGQVFRTSNDVMGFAAVRAGYLSDPKTLWYAQTGLAVAGENVRVDLGGPITSLSRTVPGYALGGGVEWALPAAPAALGPASLFLDYRHIWWESGTLDTPAADPTLNFRWQREANLLKVGLRLHF